MFGVTRWSPFDEVFNFQREVDRVFTQFWHDLPTRTAAASSTAFRVNAVADGWRIEVPMPGIDPAHVTLETAGNTLTIRAEEPGEGQESPVTRFEQTMTVPPFLDLEKISASHRHGMLQLTLPLKESVKPRRIQIQTTREDKKQLTGSAA